jgi:transposase InsO family protein
VPTGCDTPAIRAASSLEHPSAIARQNGRRSDRCKTGGRPGDLIFARRTWSDRRVFAFIAASVHETLRRSVEFTQYLSIRYTERLQEVGVEPSVGSTGDSYDNAMAESIIGLYKTEVIHARGPWRSLDAVEYATLEWVDWFNNRRLLGPIGHVPPAEFEREYYRLNTGQAFAA